MIAIKVLQHSTWPQNNRFLLASPRMDRFSRIDIRRPFALYCLPWDRESCTRKSALQLALHHMSYKAFCTWCHARNIRKPTTFIDVYRYISVQSTASLCNGPLHWSLRGMSNIPPVWGKWHGPAIWSKRSHSPIYPSSEVWLRWKSRTTVSPVRSKSLMNLPELRVHCPIVQDLEIVKGHFRTWPNRPDLILHVLYKQSFATRRWRKSSIRCNCV